MRYRGENLTMPSFTHTNTIYWHVTEYGFDVHRLKSLPCTLLGEHQGAMRKLSDEGIIRRVDKVYKNRGWRAIWGEGARYKMFMKWCERKGKI